MVGDKAWCSRTRKARINVLQWLTIWNCGTEQELKQAQPLKIWQIPYTGELLIFLLTPLHKPGILKSMEGTLPLRNPFSYQSDRRVCSSGSNMLQHGIRQVISLDYSDDGMHYAFDNTFLYLVYQKDKAQKLSRVDSGAAGKEAEAWRRNRFTSGGASLATFANMPGGFVAKCSECVDIRKIWHRSQMQTCLCSSSGWSRAACRGIVFRWLIYAAERDYTRVATAAISGVFLVFITWILQAVYAGILPVVFTVFPGDLEALWPNVLLHMGANIWSLILGLLLQLENKAVHRCNGDISEFFMCAQDRQRLTLRNVHVAGRMVWKSSCCTKYSVHAFLQRIKMQPVCSDKNPNTIDLVSGRDKPRDYLNRGSALR